MEKRLKICLVPDGRDNWSAHNRTYYLKKYITEHDFDIKGGMRHDEIWRTPDIMDDYDFLHINFSGSLQYFYPHFKRNPEKMLITLINERSFFEEFEIDLEKANEMVHGCCAASSVGYRAAEAFGIEYISNGVDFEDFKSPRRPRVLYVGTERKNKNFHLLEKVCNDLKLELRALTYEHERVPHEDVWIEYKKADVFVHPSQTEGNSNPILEALAMNLPVICTRQGIVEREFGDLVTFIEPNYNSLYNALKRFDTRKVIEERFQWSQMAYKYKLWYERAYARQQQMLKDKNE